MDYPALDPIMYLASTLSTLYADVWKDDSLLNMWWRGLNARRFLVWTYSGMSPTDIRQVAEGLAEIASQGHGFSHPPELLSLRPDQFVGPKEELGKKLEVSLGTLKTEASAGNVIIIYQLDRIVKILNRDVFHVYLEELARASLSSILVATAENLFPCQLDLRQYFDWTFDVYLFLGIPEQLRSPHSLSRWSSRIASL